MKNNNSHKKNNEGFSIPKGYFKTFPDKLFKKIKAEKYILPKNEGFTVPKNYFKTFENNLFKKIDAEKQKKVIKLTVYKKYYYTATAIAAVFLLIFTLNLIKPVAVSFDTITQNEIENYIQNNYITLNSYEIAQVFTDVNLEEINIIENNFQDDEIMDYLYENLENYNDIPFEN